jgi:hypothetical protein
MMHDCRTAQEQLIDLVFKELGEEQSLRLLAEMETCPECQEQHRSMSLTLFAFDQATASMLPEENFWSDYHETLSARLDAAVTMHAPRGIGVPFWKRMVTTSVRVPAPLLALSVLLLLGSTLFAVMRTSRGLVQEISPAPLPLAERTRIVEVPVVQDKLVTRIVYVARNNRASKDEARRRVEEAPRVEERRTDAPGPHDVEDVPLTTARGPEATMQSTHAALAGFKPAGEVKLRIIKGSYPDEK